MNTAVTTAAPQTRYWPFLIVGLVIAFFALAILLPKYMLKDVQLDPKVVYGAELPPNLKALHSLKLENGTLFEIFDQDSKQSMSFVIADSLPETPTQLTGGELLRTFIQFQAKKQQDPRVAALISQYAIAQVDPMRADAQTEEKITVHGKEIEVLRFKTVRSANYLMGMIQQPKNQIYFLALMKGDAVQGTWVEELLNKMVPKIS